MNAVHEDITIGLLITAVRFHRKQLARNVVIAFVLVLALMFTIPNYYRSDDIVYCEQITSVAKELRNVGIGKGFDIGRAEWNPDMIYPVHYVQLLRTNDFMVKILSTEIKTSDDEVLTYYDYLRLHPQGVWWNRLAMYLSNWVHHDDEMELGADMDPFRLTESQAKIVEDASKHIFCQANVKLNTLTISVFDKDPFICATMSGKIRQYLQEYMENYRRGKLMAQVDFYQQLADQAQREYDEVSIVYNNYINRHTNPALASTYIATNDLLKTKMQKYTILKAIHAHLDNSTYLLTEPTKLFVNIQAAGIPVKMAGPKRMTSPLLAAVFVLVFTLLYYIRKPLIHQLFK